MRRAPEAGAATIAGHPAAGLLTGTGVRSALISTFAGVILGLLHGASYAPPLGAWWLQLLTLAGLLRLVLPRADSRADSRADTRVGRSRWLAATGFCVAWFASGLRWLHTSMHDYGGMPSALAAFAVLLFAAYLSLFPLLAVRAGLAWARPASPTAAPGPALRLSLAVGGAWAVGEAMRGWLFTGFPWLSIGYAHVDSPLAGFAPWVGVYGIGAIACVVACLLAGAIEALGRRAAREAIALLAPATAMLALGAWLSVIPVTQLAGDPIPVRLVQGNVPQSMKFDPVRSLRVMEDYADLVTGSQARLIVLPETAWTQPWRVTPTTIADRITSAARAADAVVAIGMPLFEPAPDGGRPRYTNSVALIDPRPGDAAATTNPDRILARYDKRHLVPFGEFIPFGFGWFVRMMRIPLGEFGRGPTVQAPFALAGQRFAFNICYEDLFGEEIAASVRGPGSPGVLVNVSNIAWFGDSSALPQHLAIARMRALETGRPMLRATNTGVTASIDHRGRVLAMLPPYRQGVLDVAVQATEGLSVHARVGNLAPAALAGLLLLLARTGRARTGPQKR